MGLKRRNYPRATWALPAACWHLPGPPIPTNHLPPCCPAHLAHKGLPCKCPTSGTATLTAPGTLARAWSGSPVTRGLPLQVLSRAASHGCWGFGAPPQPQAGAHGKALGPRPLSLNGPVLWACRLKGAMAAPHPHLPTPVSPPDPSLAHGGPQWRPRSHKEPQRPPWCKPRLPCTAMGAQQTLCPPV